MPMALSSSTAAWLGMLRPVDLIALSSNPAADPNGSLLVAWRRELG